MVRRASFFALLLASCALVPPEATGGSGGGGMGGGGEGGMGGSGGTPFGGCDTCTGATPICVDDASCEAACPAGRVSCDPGAPGAAICCAEGSQCCLAIENDYPDGDLCAPADQPCPIACPGGVVACPPNEWCQVSPGSPGGYVCTDECDADHLCAALPGGGNECCGFGSKCVGGACALADIHVDTAQLAASAHLSIETFDDSACEIVEGCIDGPGDRILLRFDLKTPNTGEGDLYMGDPDGNPLFVYSPCHGHYHFESYASYRLLDGQGNEVAHGHKQAFCLLDLEQQDENKPGAGFNCGYQGISSGWADVYHAGLPCQFIDVTNVPFGDYQIEVQLNGEKVLVEADYANDKALVPYTIAPTSCPNGCSKADPACCQPNDPCGWAANGICECSGVFAWDAVDCGNCYSPDPNCDEKTTCPGGCTGNTGPCCTDQDACGLANDGMCDCQAAFEWDEADCSHCFEPSDPLCPSETTCPFGCPDPVPGCCDIISDDCGFANNGQCDCFGMTDWDTQDCSFCLSANPNCP